MFNDVMEAYRHTMGVIDGLAADGITVVRRPSRSQNNAEVRDKYGGPDRLPPTHWWHVTFRCDTPEKTQIVFEAKRALGWKGINFDTGGGVGVSYGERDWEIDWSFHLTGVPDGDAEERCQIVEDMLTGQSPEDRPE